MKAFALAIFVWVAAQALPATLQIYPPEATAAAATIAVGAGGDLQGALDRARAGDIVELAPGASFIGNFVLPARAGTRFSILRTAPTAGLPDTTGRIGPHHAAQLARIQSPNGLPALRTAAGAHHWRVMLIEFGPNAGGVGDIIALGDGSPAQSEGAGLPHDLIIDRCYIHGDPQHGQKRGIALNSGATVVVGSHISDIKSTSQDAQAIAGWSGPGPFQIENNYLEASGENFMLGGAVPGATGLVPSDVVFRHNHVARPPSWKSESWAVKNLFELKNARRVLVEGNLFENNWVSAQPGYAIVLTPRGERGAASWATVEDVTFRYNVIRNTAAVFNMLGRDDAGPSGTIRRLRIADNLIYGVDRAIWGGNGTFLQIGEGPSELVVEHNTVIQTGNVITAYGGTREAPTPIERFIFQNNLTRHNANGVIGQGLAIGTDTLNAYFPGNVFLKNVLAGGRSTRYPSDNMFPDTDRFAQQFVNYAGQDYRLRTDSEFRRGATDGADLGVNFVGLVRALGTRAREWLNLPAAAPAR